MDKSLKFRKFGTLAIILAAAALTVALGSAVRLARAQSTPTAVLSSDSELIAQFRRVEVASVSDALEQITGKRMYMSHRMQPIFTAKFAGFARTVQLKKDEGNQDPEALSGMLEAIDQGSTDSVYVMVVEDGEDIAGMGGLMGTAMAARGYAGAVSPTCARLDFPCSPPGSCLLRRCITTVLRAHRFPWSAMGSPSIRETLWWLTATAWPSCPERRLNPCSVWRSRWTSRSTPCMPSSSN
jgi:hypothetical protein